MMENPIIVLECPFTDKYNLLKLPIFLLLLFDILEDVKLGVSGLINAYKTAAQMALENSEIIEKTYYPITLSVSLLIIKT